MKFSVLVLLFAVGGSWAADPLLVDEIVCKVNGDIITRGDLEKGKFELQGLLQQQGLKGAELQRVYEEQSKNILRDRIDQFLLVQKGKDLNLNVESELSKYMAEIQKKSGIGDPEKFQDYVRQNTGMSFEDWKSEQKNGMLTQRVIRQEVGGKMNVKRDEVQKYYSEHMTEFVREEQVLLREILVSTKDLATGKDKDAAGIAAAEKKAKDLTARARKGERFPELARDNSDAVTAQNFGELGAFKAGMLNATIEKLVWTQPKGYVTDPVRVDAGFEIFKVEEHTKQGQAALEDVESEITERLYAPKMQPAVREFLTKLRSSAFLEIKNGYVDSGAAPGKNTAWVDPATLKPETTTKKEVSSKIHHKRLLWAIPVPGTTTAGSGAKGVSTSKVSSSK